MDAMREPALVEHLDMKMAERKVAMWVVRLVDLLDDERVGVMVAL